MPADTALAVRSEFEITQPQAQLLAKAMKADGLSEQQFYLFVEYVKRARLDPFIRQIYAVRDKRGGMAVMVGIDGLRVLAQRTGELAGQDGPWWKAEGGEWQETWDSDEPPYACKVSVYRLGAPKPWKGIVHYREFVQRNDKGLPRGNWASMPAHMLAIRAESHALRKAFPAETAGLYVNFDDGTVTEARIQNPDAKVSNDQLAVLHIIPEELGWDDDGRHLWASRMLKREVDSFDSLTKAEANLLISELQLLRAPTEGEDEAESVPTPADSQASSPSAEASATEEPPDVGQPLEGAEDASGVGATSSVTAAGSGAAIPAPEVPSEDPKIVGGRYDAYKFSRAAEYDPDYMLEVEAGKGPSHRRKLALDWTYAKHPELRP